MSNPAALAEGEKILVVDDDARLRRLLERFLDEQGYRVRAVENTEQMDRLLSRELFQLVVLDLMLPGEDGLTACRRLREQNNQVPIIMLTAKGDEGSRIQGLELGADDYLTKPFDPRELLARLRAVQRRVGEQASRGEAARPVIGFAGWHLDVTCRELRSPEQVMIPLSGAEFDLLVVFLEHPQRILTREQLIDLTRGQGHDAYDRSIDVQVSRLRRKIEPDSKRPDLIRTVRNGGYLFTAKVSRS